MTPVQAGTAPAPLWLRATELALAGLIYFALARASLEFASLNASATPIWPPTGFAIALILMRGPTMTFAVALGALCANYLATPSLATAGVIAVGNSLEAFAAAALLQRWAEGEQVFYTPLGILKFAFIVIGAAAPISATIGLLALAGGGYALWAEAAPVWFTWWLGDVGGAILVTPALVLWARTWRGLETREVALNALITFLVAALIGVLAFSPLSPAPNGVRSALAFLVILPLLWSALRLGLRDTATTALVISSFAVWGALADSSPFNRDNLNDSLLLLITFIIAATLPSLALAADRRETQTTLRAAREELVQAQKLEALGQLTGGVAHDFNNLLAAISGGLRSLTRQDEERAKTLEAITQNLERGAALTRQLLAFARREPPKPELIHLNELMGGVETLLAPALKDGVTLEIRAAPGLWPIKVDRSQLELALLNLVINARDAMPDGGQIVITAENGVSGHEHEVCVTVSDTGPGMPEEVRVRAFEPFFSTKPAGAGTGLGLAQVYNFAKLSGGSASIESAPGHGAAITITLPRASS